MFENIGNKLKSLANLYIFIGMMLVIPLFLWLLSVMSLVTPFFLVSLLLCVIISASYLFFIYLTSCLIYAVGEMADNSNHIRNYTRETRDKATNIDKTVVLIDGFLIKNAKDNRTNNENQEI